MTFCSFFQISSHSRVIQVCVIWHMTSHVVTPLHYDQSENEAYLKLLNEIARNVAQVYSSLN